VWQLAFRQGGAIANGGVMLSNRVEGAGDSRTKILDAAKEEISSKGFSGARMDKIAETAGVNKALIYYYFKSKEGLRHEIISEFFCELFELKASLSSGQNDCDDETRRYIFENIYEFAKQRKAVIRIVLSEMAKGEAQAEQIIAMNEPVLYLFIKKLETQGIVIDHPDIHYKYKLLNIFFGLIPLLMFTVLEDKMAKYFAVDDTEVVQEFRKIGTQIHSACIKDLLDKFSPEKTKKADQ
jgi:AcrR family transcriptional regulator